MKKLLSLVLAVCLLVLPASNAFAETTYPKDKDMSVNASQEVTPYWLAPGEHTQYPNEGGTWTYGFWNVKVRSYYTVNRCHGSTVILNGKAVRSVDTIAGEKSIAEKWALNYWGNDDEYYYRVCD